MRALIIGSILILCGSAFAEGTILVKVSELTNLRGNAGLEACGTATHVGGVKPLLVNIKHDESSYTTLTDKDGKWCVVIKRWTYDGKVFVSASTLDFKDVSDESKD